MEKIQVKVLKDDGVQLPQYMTLGAAGMDVFAHIKTPIILESLERKIVSTGIKVEIPYGYEIQIRPRSGLALKHGITLLNSPGTIDSDYRGEIGIILVNLSKDSYKINPMERIGQFVLQKVYKIEFLEVEELGLSERLKGAFGHTGKY